MIPFKLIISSAKEGASAMTRVRRVSSAVVACSLFSFVALVGCGPSKAPTPAPPPQPSIQPGSAGWGYAERHNAKAAGIDYAGVLYWSWDGAIVLAVWIDHAAQTKGGLEFTTGKEALLKGSLLSQEGKTLTEISCTTSDGKAGRLTVGGQELDLAGGWLVLVATEGGRPRLKQLKRPPLTDPNGIKAMRGESEIAEFFAPKSK